MPICLLNQVLILILWLLPPVHIFIRQGLRLMNLLLYPRNKNLLTFPLENLSLQLNPVHILTIKVTHSFDVRCFPGQVFLVLQAWVYQSPPQWEFRQKCLWWESGASYSSGRGIWQKRGMILAEMARDLIYQWSWWLGSAIQSSPW